MPLKPMVVEEPFQQWGLDFIGVINPNSTLLVGIPLYLFPIPNTSIV